MSKFNVYEANAIVSRVKRKYFCLGILAGAAGVHAGYAIGWWWMTR